MFTNVRWTPRILWIAAALAAPGVAGVPDGAPSFSDPLDIAHPYFPFEVDGVKVYRGKDEGEKIMKVDHHRPETRDFLLNGVTVSTRVLREVDFEEGDLAEVSFNYFAQADDGTVYYFGEINVNYEDGEVIDHEGSWLVGGPGVEDPLETLTVDAPFVYMPPDPAIGDVFMPENVNEEISETVTVVGFEKVKTEGGKFKNALKVKCVEGDGETEKKWYAEGIGLVRVKSQEEIFALASTTLRPPED